MSTYKVTIKYWVQEEIIVEAESEDEAGTIAKNIETIDDERMENREVVSDIEIEEVEEI